MKKVLGKVLGVFTGKESYIFNKYDKLHKADLASFENALTELELMN